MTWRSIATVALAWLAAATLCALPSPVDPDLPGYRKVSGVSGSLTSTGSDTMNGLMTLWGEIFRRYYPSVTLQIEGKGSSAAPTALLAGTAQIGAMSRPLRQREVLQFEARYGYRPTQVRVARDALAVFVHRDNPIGGLTLAQLDAVFGKLRRRGHRPVSTWGDLGLTGEWARRPISLFGRNAASGSYGFFKDRVLQNGDFKDSVKEQPGSGSVVQGVTDDRFAIGYSGIGARTSGVRVVALAEDADGAGSSGPFADVGRDAYPLTRDLLIALNKAPGRPLPPLELEFLTLVYSREGQAAVARDGYLPLTASQARDQLSHLTGAPSAAR